MDALMVSTKSNTTEATTNIFNYTTMFGIFKTLVTQKIL